MASVQGELWDSFANSGNKKECASGSAKVCKPLKRNRNQSTQCIYGANDFSRTFEGFSFRIQCDHRDDSIWFAVTDICSYFGDTNPSRLAASVDPDSKQFFTVSTADGNRSLLFVNEGGLYQILFSMRPTKARGVNQEYINTRIEQVSKFKRWVTHEVLPSIRKTGGYVAAKPEDPPEVIMARALIVADATIKQYKSKVDAMCIELAEQATAIEEMTPKAALADDFLISKGSILVRDFAKHIKLSLHLRSWGEKRMFAWLKSRGYMNQNRYPSQLSVQLGVLDVRQGTHFEGLEQVMHHVTRINAKGQDYFLKKLKEEKELGVLEVGID